MPVFTHGLIFSLGTRIDKSFLFLPDVMSTGIQFVFEKKHDRAFCIQQ